MRVWLHEATPTLHDPNVTILWAACCLSLLALCERENLRHLPAGLFDPESILMVRVSGPTCVTIPAVCIAEAAAEQGRPIQGRSGYLTGAYKYMCNVFCPVVAVLAYIAVRHKDLAHCLYNYNIMSHTRAAGGAPAERSM